MVENSIDTIRVRVTTLNISSGGRCWGCQKSFVAGGENPLVGGIDNSLLSPEETPNPCRQDADTNENEALKRYG